MKGLNPVSEKRTTNNSHASTGKFVDIAEYVDINGIKQFLYHTGDFAENQVILHLHGGPGNAFSNKAYLLKNWNSHFTMVYWDQRGAGKTALKNPTSVPTFDNLLKDINEIILYLKKKYNKDKIGIFAHSWGTIIGSIYANQHPEHLAFYIGVGQVVAPIENEVVTYHETIRRLKEIDDQDAINMLEKMGAYPGERAGEFSHKMGIVRQLQKKIGMISINPQKNVEAIKQSPLFHPDDLNTKKVCAHLLPSLFEEMFPYSLYHYPLTYQIPVYYILGEDDWQVPSVLGVDYFNKISAPDKELILIKEAKHTPMLEKPDEFLKAMRKVVGC